MNKYGQEHKMVELSIKNPKITKYTANGIVIKKNKPVKVTEKEAKQFQREIEQGILSCKK